MAPARLVSEAQPLAEPLEDGDQSHLCAEQRRGAAWVDRPHLVTVVHGDHVNPVEHDRAGRLNDSATPSAHSQRARQHEPRIGE